jgi:lysophospholipase L1-like esterase
MIRDPLRHRIDWDLLEARICPSQYSIPPVERTDVYSLIRHDQDLQQVATGHGGQVVFLGDSITDWWANGAGTTVWNQTMAPLGAADFGVVADQAENLLWRIENGELAGDPKVAVVEIGTNNLGFGHTVDYTVSAIEAVVNEIKALSPTTQVVLMGLFPRGSASDPLRAEVNQTNGDLATWAQSSSGVTFLDIDSALAGPGGSIASDFLPDQLHPNADGYAAWAEGLEGTILGLLGEAPAPVAGTTPTATTISPSTGTSAPATAATSTAADEASLGAPAQVAEASAELASIDATPDESGSPAAPPQASISGTAAASEEVSAETTADASASPPVTTARVGQSLAAVGANPLLNVGDRMDTLLADDGPETLYPPPGA